MTSPEGAFYSAEDADSDGEEGKYYVWTIDQLKDLLTDKEFKLFSEWFPVNHQGNFSEQSTGANVLYLNTILSEKQKKLAAPIIKKLFNARLKRIPPLKDQKILTDWNALMIASFAKGASVLQSKQYQDIAIRAMDFLCQNMLRDDFSLMHRYKDNDIAIKGKLDDYAFMINALLELYATTFQPRYLEIALGLNTYALDHFWDRHHHGFFLTSDHDETLIARPKEAYDGAIPSGNAVFAKNLIKLSKMTGNMAYEKKAEDIILAFSDMINRVPQAFTQMIMAYQFAKNDSYEIVVCGKETSSESKDILKYLQSNYHPDIVALFKGEESSKSYQY
ncbi:MAG: hypothetical protein OMM_12733, partial [Candidatus Magnetoglobus multicellularis str. Araruama]